MVSSKLELKLKCFIWFRASSSSSSNFLYGFEQAQAQARTFCTVSSKLELKLELFFWSSKQPEIDESANNGSNAKGKNKDQPKVQLDSADKTGNQKGHVKVSLQEELFAPDGAMNFYGSAQPEPDINPEEMETDTEEQGAILDHYKVIIRSVF